MKFVSHPLIYPNSIEDREFQRTIVREAADRNTLVVLPTALGKTIISALIAADVLFKHSDKKVLMMAPSRPLVMQHNTTFLRILKLPRVEFTILTGETPPDDRANIWKGHSRVVFATPQVVRNDIASGAIKLDNFGLLIFDEAHRSVKDYAYTEVARQYVEQSNYPLILGITASPGSNLERIRKVCDSLFIEHVECRSEDDPDVKAYIQAIDVEWRRVSLPSRYQPLSNVIREMLERRVTWLCNKGYLKGTFKYTNRRKLLDLGAELRQMLMSTSKERRGPIFWAMTCQSSALTLFHMLELLETQGSHTLKNFVDRIGSDDKRSHRILMKDEKYSTLRKLLDDAVSTEHPKIEELRLLVRNQLTENPRSRMLIFTQYRDTASHLVEALNSIPGMRTERFVGQANRLGDAGLTQERQTSLIDDLRVGRLNALVATSIAEEGLDIPEVDLVVFYEPIPSEIRYIQRRGRTGRRISGKAIILATDNTYDMVYLYASSKKVKRMGEVVQKLNNMLKPVLGMRTRPQPSYMTHEELEDLQRSASEVDAKIVSEKGPRGTRGLDRDVSKAEKSIYHMILERGTSGLDDEEIVRQMKVEGFQSEVIDVALSKLARSKYVARKNGRSSIHLREMPGASMMEIEVEKVIPGRALVRIDDKLEAIVLPDIYEGPRNLIRKGSRFRALCELYQQSDELYVRIRQVIQAL